MKRVLVASLVGMIVAGSVGVSAAANRYIKRVEKQTYYGSVIPTPSGGFTCAGSYPPGPSVGCPAFERRPADLIVEAEIEDAAGLDVSAAVVETHWDDERQVYTFWDSHRFCAATNRPIRLAPETNRIFIAIYQERCVDGRRALATTGDVALTIWRRP